MGGERSSRVTSPTRRRGHRRRRRHFTGAFGLRSAFSARERKPRRSTSRSPTLFTSRLSLRTHAARSTPRRGRLAALPFLFRPATPPSAHPLRALAHPAQPGSQSAAGRETRSQAAAGGVRVSRRRWRSRRASRGCAASLTAAHSAASAAQRAPGHSHRPVPRPVLRRFSSRPSKGN